MKTDEETKRLLAGLVQALEHIAGGDRMAAAPSGLEGLTMAIGGEGVPGRPNLCEAISEVGEALQAIADANHAIADAIKSLKT